MDFMTVSTKMSKTGMDIYPKFWATNSNDLMIRGGDFYAIWDEKSGLWSTSKERAIDIIDTEIREYAKAQHMEGTHVLYLKDVETGMIDRWNKYCKQQMWENYVSLDNHLVFKDDPIEKNDYSSKRLNYNIEECDISAYEELMNVLYDESERMKIEWAIGAVLSGDSVNIQKFLVLYGDKGTGKSTVLNIIQLLFDGYFAVFDAKALGSGKDFALEPLKNNPLVAIQHDGDLSRIEDNTLLNSIVSHEIMTVNEKFKPTYSMRFNSFLFMGTNRPVKITDSKSGILRRLIDVSPTGNKVTIFKYKSLMKDIKFELGGIAKHCLDIYEANKNLYDNYVPTAMMGASNDFYNYIQDVYDYFTSNEVITLKVAWDFYTKYCDDARVPYPLSQRLFKEELKNYFEEFRERGYLEDGSRVRNLYVKFKPDAFQVTKQKVIEPESKFIFSEQASVLDDELSNCPAQYATKSGKPTTAWDDVETKLCDLDTHELHYVRVPSNHIVIDFDIPDESGNKSFKKNLEAANNFPLTYAELSKSGAGIHLHYLYSGDVSQLSSVYGEHIEVKVFSGKSSLRRRLTKCNNVPIATISSGLPLKKAKGDNMIDMSIINDEKHLENKIIQNLNKEVHSNTTQSVHFIKKILDDAYNSGMHYDMRPLKKDIERFAKNSTHNGVACLKLLSNVHYCSDDILNGTLVDIPVGEKPIAFYDVEVFPNLFILCYKIQGTPDDTVVSLINPDADEVSRFINSYRLIGFNNRRYDNHIIYARARGYNNAQIYDISKGIISKDNNAFFGPAWNLSYTDIYDFMAVKRSLKKLEIEMGINHVELGLDWDKPVPKELWEKVASYCCNDVIATEAAFDYLIDDWEGRKILAKLAGGTVNMSTNALSTMFIFGNNKEPQTEFNYRNLAEPKTSIESEEYEFLADIMPDMLNYHDIRVPDSWFPFFEGYTFENGVSTYKGEEVGEGGYVYAEPGMYDDVALLDISSMHPHSIVAEVLFGVEYTRRFYSILKARLMVKHGELDKLVDYLDGVFKEVVDDIKEGKVKASALAYALKIVINSVYGLTKARFKHPFRDPRNIDNIVAKRGALFMVDLKKEVQKRGFTVAHIKTDSIKIPNATPEIIEFVMEFGKRYGYFFEHEATYERMCLVNNAVYIAKYADGDHEYKLSTGEKINTPWTATGKQFQVPYIFKSWFAKTSPITIRDMAETKSSQTALYLDKNEGLGSDKHQYQFIGKVGQFSPVKPGYSGGDLVAQAVDKDGNVKYDFAQEAKGYKWKETLDIKDLNEIDTSFYTEKVDEAKAAIEQFGDFEAFVS